MYSDFDRIGMFFVEYLISKFFTLSGVTEQQCLTYKLRSKKSFLVIYYTHFLIPEDRGE